MHPWRKAVLLLLCLVCQGGWSQADRIETFPSTLLHRSVQLALHVPEPGVLRRFQLAHPGERLPLVLFLPGAWDGPADLLDKGIFPELSRREAVGASPALWVAVPNFSSWYADRRNGRFPYARFLMEELLPALEGRFQAGGSASTRAIAGLSMGGFGALNLAARTGAFGRVLALSPALVQPPYQGSWYTRWNLRRVFGNSLEAFTPWNPWRHLGGQTEVRLACGTSDKYGLAPVTEAFARKRREAGLPVRLTLRPGDHDWVTWKPMILEDADWLAGGS